ncbi:protein BPS1, chloroplastic [Vigna radiata var. radiata]|uniref:Protein BPS1, chloroplastic n=1 Tax=Vigna radiata var. radiata TaxID=3916 RepID=A0A1S3U1T6_VIGRR|nr:protein BPS1, chloroplastic [Vigna radiata var. radiata]
MVLLIEKLAKHCFFKLENRHHSITYPHQEELPSSSSFLAFKFHVSESIDQLALDLKARSETLSLTWFERCLALLPLINKAFAKLVADMDYPMSKWGVGSTEGYLCYTLSLLELFNSISSCISHLGQARISLAHGLTLLENSPSLARKHLKGIQFQPGGFSTNLGKDLEEARVFSDKERIVHEAVKEMRCVGFWVCGVLFSCLYGDGKSYMELRKVAGGFDSSLVATLDFEIGEQFMEKISIFAEIKEVNDAVADLVAADEVRRHYAAKELQTKLQVLEKLSDSISKEVDNLFANVMTQRSKLIDGFRLQQQPQKSSF